MNRQDLDIEKTLLVIADMQSFGNVQDKLTRVITETLSDISKDYGELDEADLELVRAAALPNYQQFCKKYLDGCNKE